MVPFAYGRAADLDAATAMLAAEPQAEIIAGGTDMLQLLKDDVRRPSRLIDINALPLAGIEAGPAGTRIGALARMAAVADHPGIRAHVPAVAEALLAAASPQVRNMGTVGGNLLQRTRCTYYRDVGVESCNKRRPGSGCAALDGENRMHAILGTSEHCIATHPSDMPVALVALDATVRLAGPGGERSVPIGEFYRLPGDTPHLETVLGRGELIVAVEIPAAPHARRSHYLKVRDRASFEFALASAAVGLDIRDGTIRSARVAAGGVGTMPWRLAHVEEALVGRPASPETFAAAAALAAEGASPRQHNAFKPELLRRTVARALAHVGRPA